MYSIRKILPFAKRENSEQHPSRDSIEVSVSRNWKRHHRRGKTISIREYLLEKMCFIQKKSRKLIPLPGSIPISR